MATDYSTSCSDLALSWYQMLASTIVGYADIAGVTHYRLNTITEGANCSDLTDFLTCDLSHITPERQLVENVFALDDCGEFLAMKFATNSDNDWVDYNDCGELPPTFLEMLSRTIVLYDGHYRINAVFDGAACAGLTPLLSCTTNEIDAERMLVQNLFATDDCGHLLIKLLTSTSGTTDYATPCATTPETFLEMLARCIVLYDGHYYLNLVYVNNNCDDLTAFWNCNNNHIEPERALVENVFALDDCGNLALKVFYNTGAEGGEQ